jgi:ABC-type transport system involved in multi-copper enzyme maturation permease subunit
LLIVGAVATMIVTAGYGSEKTTPADLERAEQAASQERATQRARCEVYHRTEGQAAPGSAASPSAPVSPSTSASAAPTVPASPSTPADGPAPTSVEPPFPGEFEGVDCATITYPVAADMMDHRTFSLRSEMPGRAAFVAVLLALVGYLVGASYVGAEWQHGTMAGLLLWEPRRVKVYTAKLFALLGGLLFVGVTTYALAFVGHWVVADLVGDPTGVGRDLQRSLGLTVARGLALSLVVAACGFAIAYAVRLSAAALGVAVAYIVGAEVALRAFSQESHRWLLTENITAWLNRGTKIYLSHCDSQGNCTEKILDVSMWQGGAYVGGLALVLTVVAAIIFARRDVT